MSSDGALNEEKGKPSLSSSKVEFLQPMSSKILDLISKLQSNYPFFAEMDEKEIEEFLRQCKSESFKEGGVIFEKGEEGDKFYLIVSGDVLIFPGKAEIRLEPGNVFGEMALLDQTSRTATAMAATDATLFSMHRDIFSTDMVGLRCKIAIGIAKQLSEKLRNANQILNQVSEQLSMAMKGIAEHS